MKRLLLISMGFALVTGFSSFGPAADARPTVKVDVCHFDTDTGTFHKINISGNAFDKHIAHGDGVPFGPVPEMPDYEFGEDCALVPIPCPEGCTQPLGYWRNHPEEWPASRADATLCESPWLEILLAPSEGNPWLLLAHQWITAELNVAAGASPADLGDTLDDAQALLDTCSIGSEDLAWAHELSEFLKSFNTGEIGPGLCDPD